jgi:hypothetical protein
MDTKTAAADVDRQIAEIRRHMPFVYASILAKAAQFGNAAFGMVRRGLRGEPYCFYAFERGRVVGTPFEGHEIQAEVAVLMVEFGRAHVCIWAVEFAGGGAAGLASDGAAGTIGKAAAAAAVASQHEEASCGAH